MKSLKSYWNFLSSDIRRFLMIALVLIISWKLLYHFYLKPQRVIDKPLTIITTKATIAVYNLFSSDTLNYYVLLPNDNFTHFATVVTKNNHKILSIADPCNALELMVLYVGFLFCLYINLKRAVKYTSIGIGTIFILNILRCIGMIWIALNEKNWFHFAHHYLFTLVVYSFIFMLWVLYAKSFNKIENEV